MINTVSITIPCKNEEKYIAPCLQSIVEADYPHELLRVFVVDGRSEDRTREIVKRFEDHYSYIQLIDNPKEVTPVALNLGLQHSNSDVKIILGAHSTIDSSFIQRNVDVLTSHPEIGCSGGVIDNVNENESAEIIALAMSSSFGVGNAHFRTGGAEGYVDTVAFGAYRKEVFEKIGFFDEELVRNQDDEFNYRLLKNGFKIYLDKKIRSSYSVRGDFKKLFKQYFQYGYWKVYVNLKHKSITTIRQLVPLLFVKYLIVGLVGSLMIPSFTYVYLLGLFFYLFVGVYFALKKTTVASKVFKVLMVFFVLHTSYGYGYLRGVLDFILLRKKPGKKSKELSR